MHLIDAGQNLLEVSSNTVEAKLERLGYLPRFRPTTKTHLLSTFRAGDHSHGSLLNHLIDLIVFADAVPDFDPDIRATVRLFHTLVFNLH